MRRTAFIALLSGVIAATAPSHAQNAFGYVTPPDSSTTSTDPVGSISSTFAVSPLGAATYTIPIECPQGLPGATPQIAITYNSQAGNGVAGYGCSISGISVITRVSRDIFHDGAAAGISYTPNDAFSLDGQRLILTQAAAGSDSAVYCLENDPRTRIVHHGLTSAYLQGEWFSVDRPDGMYYEYGRQYLSRQCVFINGFYNNMSWYVDKAVSPNGSYISYGYEHEGRTVYLKEIDYGYNNDSRIIFEYESRPDTLKFRLLGLQGFMSRRLHNVISAMKDSGSWNTYRSYTMEYSETEDGTPRIISRLTAISEANGNNEVLRPLTFNWQGLPGYFPSINTRDIDYIGFTDRTVEINEEGTQIMAADFNGDGISDILQKSVVRVRPGTGNMFDCTDFYFRLSHVNQDGTVTFQYPICCRLDAGVIVDNWSVTPEGPLVADADGDGLNDLLVPYSVTGNYNHYVYVYYIYGKSLGSAQIKRYTLQNSNESPLFTVSDIDGDGRSELVILEVANNGGNSYDCCIFSGTGTDGTINETRLTLPVFSKPKHLFAADYNNDGASDLIVSHDNGYVVFWNQGGGLSSSSFSSSACLTSSSSVKGYRMYEGDFNGDGTPDFLITDKDCPTWHFALGKGDGTFEIQSACSIDAYEQSATPKDDGYLSCSILDIDGDGMSDAVISKAVYAGIEPFSLYLLSRVVTYWLLSDGKKLNVHETQTSYHIEGSSPRYYMTGDFNGDGFVELANYGYNCYSGTTPSDDETTRFYTCSGITRQTGKMTGIIDGMGNTTAITYDTFSNPQVYNRNAINTDTTYPIATPSLPLSVVKSVSSENGAAGQEQTSYNYSGLRVHKAGKGIMGMTTFRRVNYTTETTDETIISGWDTISYRPSAVTTRRHTISESATSNTSYTHTARQYGNGRKAFFTYPHSSTTTDFDNNTTTTTNTYDTQICLPTETRVTNAGGQRVTSYTDYVLRGGRYQPGRIETTTTYTGKPSFSETVSYTYDAKGRRSSVTTGPGTSFAVTTSYTYDSWGNMLSSTTQDGNGDLEAIVNTWEYDSRKRNVTRSVERGYIVKEYTYDLWGNILTETDKTRPAYPQTTRYTYDGWGNLKTVLSPNSLLTAYKRGWGASQSRKYYVLEQGTARPWVKTWYDSRGREVLTQSIGQKEIALSSATTYNQKGLVQQRTDTRGGSTVTESFTYDQRGRVLTDILSTGSSTSYSYLPNKVTLDENGRSSVKEFDAWGNLKKSTDAMGNVTTYSYASCGKPSSVTSCGTAVTMQYDEAGNQIRLTDPDAGTMTYTYDAYGRVKTQKDGRNYTTTNTYDTKGRLSSSSTAGTATTYTYGQDSSNMGLLLSTSRSGNTISYAYDRFGRDSVETRTVSGLGTRTFQYTYGSNGLLLNVLYPGAVNVGYQYDSYGNRSKVTVGGTTVWQVTNISAQNSAITTMAQLGSSLKTTQIADLAGRVTGKSLQYIYGVPIRSMTFTYNAATGNMTGRNGMFPESEVFTYDDLDRLTCIEYGNVSTKDVTYAPNGNITMQTDIGRYYYEGGRPHALTSVDNTRHRIPTSQLQTQYNAFGKVSQIRDYGENNYKMLFDYGPDDERWRTRFYRNTSTLQRTTYYMGDYEETVKGGITRRLYYLDGNVLYKKQTSQPDSVFYLFTDHLGSVICIVDQNGSEKFHATYDAWGNQTVTRNDIGFHRGYTGHEMLPEFGLINMNGRLYDPQIGRFLSTDNFVQEPWNSQNFNRYSYCLNNPLKYSDSSGELFGVDDVLAAIIIGAAIGGTINLGIKAYNGQIHSWQDGLAAFGIGATAGALSAATGVAAAAAIGVGSASVGASIITGMASAAFSAPVQSIGNSMYFGDPVMSGSEYLWTVAGSGIASGAFTLAGNAISGRNLWTGELKRNTYTQSLNNDVSDNVLDFPVPENHQIDITPKYNQNPKPNEWPNPSAVPGSESRDILLPGIEIDRWSPSSEGVLRGTFFSTPEVDIRFRAIPYDPGKSYHAIFKVVEPLPVNGSLASPSFIWNSPGMGYQFQFIGNKSAIQMMEAGQIKLLIIRFGY